MTRAGAWTAMLALLAASASVVHAGMGLVPPPMLLRYGFDFECRPTGERFQVGEAELVVIGPGCFRAGSSALGDPGDLAGRAAGLLRLPLGDSPQPSDLMPLRWVEFREGFAIATRATSWRETRPWRHRFPFSRWGHHEDDGLPVWLDHREARDFCAWLAETSGRPVRLPTEAEWECAMRAGALSETSWEPSPTNSSDYSWRGDWAIRTPNAWGLLPVTQEWCADAPALQARGWSFVLRGTEWRPAFNSVRAAHGAHFRLACDRPAGGRAE